MGGGKERCTYDQCMPFDPKVGEHDLAAVLTLELLFRTEMDFVMNTARRCGLSDADAEDVTQQVFMALQRRLYTLQAPESVRPWLVIVTRRYALGARGASRREAGESVPDDIGEIEDEGPLAEEQLLGSERRREFLDLLESIEPGRRAVLVMHVLDELPMSEVAAALRIPVATGYNRLRLARHDLRDAFERRHLADEYGFLSRLWEKVVTVRDPWEALYGRAAIEQAVRERLWARIVDAITGVFSSIGAAEADGLRVLSPIWKTDAKPRPYRRPRRPRNLLTSERVGLPPLPAVAAAAAATGSRTL